MLKKNNAGIGLFYLFLVTTIIFIFLLFVKPLILPKHLNNNKTFLTK